MTYPASGQTYTGDGAAEDFVDIGDMFKTLWRNKVWIVLFTALCVAIGAIYVSSVATAKYRATSVILLDTSTAQLVDIGGGLPNLGSSSQSINTEVEVLKSRRLLGRVVNAEGLTDDPEFNGALRPPRLKARLKTALFGASTGTPDSQGRATERAINALLARVSARNVPKTNVLRVTVESQSPAKSAALADQIAAQYILYQMDVKFEATRDASRWLSQRVADLSQELEQSEARVATYSARSDVISEASVMALDRQLKDLRNRLGSAQSSLQTAGKEVALLKALSSAPPAQKAQAVGDTRLALIYKTSGASPAFDDRFNSILQRATLQSQRANTQTKTLRTSIASLETQIATQSEQLIQLQQLNRDAEASRLLYEYFLTRLKENSAQEGMQQAESRILSNAVVPSAPSEPRKSLILMMSVIVGLFAGSGGVLIRDAMLNNFRLAADLEHETGFPVMGQIPLLPTKDRRENLVYLSKKPTSRAAEAIRNLRTSVLLSDIDDPPKVIMSTSSVPNEGKTTISFALAQNLVGMGKKVLLVEGDIRRRVFSHHLDVKDSKGLKSVLSKKVTLKEAALHNPILGADILISEPSNVNAADILSSQGFGDFLNSARAAYDFVIIDTPPVLVVPDARVIAPKVDMVLFTVHWDRTKKHQVHDALRMFTSIGVTVGGLVLNQINASGMKRYGHGDRYKVYDSTYYSN